MESLLYNIHREHIIIKQVNDYHVSTIYVFEKRQIPKNSHIAHELSVKIEHIS